MSEIEIPSRPTSSRQRECATPYALCALALIGLLSSHNLPAINISDEDGNSIGFGARLQSRLEFNQGVNDAAGNPATDQAGVDTVDLYLRRVRLYIKGKTAWQQSFMLSYRADNLGNARSSDTDDRRNATPEVYLGYVRQSFKGGHSITAGLQRPIFLRSEAVSSSARIGTSSAQMSTIVPNAVASRDLSIAYAYRGDAWSVDTTVIDPSYGDSRSHDWQVAVRLSTGFAADTMVRKLTESFVGKEGFEHLAAIGYAYRWNAKNGDATTGDGHALIADYTLHADSWTVLADFAWLDDGSEFKTGWSASLAAGYAIPTTVAVWEPALRLEYVDFDERDTAGTWTPSGDGNGSDGTYIEVGANAYFHGHSNKLQAGLVFYTPEAGDGDAVSFRVQHQLNF